MRKLLSALLVWATLLLSMTPAFADLPLRTSSGTANPYLYLNGLTGQAACSVTLSGITGGTAAVEGIYAGTTTWTNPLTAASPDGTSSNTSITAAGSYVFNCANMSDVRLDASGATGTITAVLNAGPGVNRIIGAGVNGGRTIVAGAAPITVTNSGNTATVGLTTPLSIANGGTNNTTFTANTCLRYDGTEIASASADCSNGVQTVTAGNSTITVGGTTQNPTVALSTPVSIANGGTGTTSFTASRCVTVTSSTLLGYGQTECLGNFTTANFVVPAVGSSVTVTTNGNRPNIQNYVPVTISDGTHSMSGIITSGKNTTSLTVTNTGVIAGNVGDTMASGAFVLPGGTGSVTSVNAGLNITITTTTGVGPTVALSNNPSITGTYTTTQSSGNGFYVGTGGSGDYPQAFGVTNSNTQNTDFGSDSTHSLNSVAGSCGAISLYQGSTYVSTLQTFNCVGSVGLNNVHASTLYSANLTSGNCVQASTNGQLTTITGACGTGNVNSVTSTDPNFVIGGTAQNPTLALNSSPTVTGTITSKNNSGINFYAGDSSTVNHPQAFGATNASGMNTDFGPDNAHSINSITGACAAISDYSGTTFSSALMTFDCSGNVGVTTLKGTNLYSTALTTSKCVRSTTGGQLVSATADCPSTFVLNLGFGYVPGTVSTSSDYPVQQVPGYTNGQITKLHAACKTADNGTTVFTFTDSTASSTIGTITMGASTTGNTTLGTPYALTAGHVLTASVTTAGTATGCGLTAEGTASLQ